jgi:hypothetical protein
LSISREAIPLIGPFFFIAEGFPYKIGNTAMILVEVKVYQIAVDKFLILIILLNRFDQNWIDCNLSFDIKSVITILSLRTLSNLITLYAFFVLQLVIRQILVILLLVIWILSKLTYIIKWKAKNTILSEQFQSTEIIAVPLTHNSITFPVWYRNLVKSGGVKLLYNGPSLFS